MRYGTPFWTLPVILAAALPLSWGTAGWATTPQGAAAVMDVRVGDHNDKTRFVMELTAPLDFNLFMLADPYRVVIDFPATDWQVDRSVRGGVGLIDAYYPADLGDATTRMVIDLTAPVRVRDVFYLPATAAIPYRFVLDLEPSDATTFAADMRSPIGTPSIVDPSSVPPPSLPAAVGGSFALATAGAASATAPVAPGPRWPTIVIDPGHGGTDPGAIGIGGLYEKEVTLSVSRQLRDALTATGRYHVVMTRDEDIFLPLRDRVGIARAAGADLFISVHADSNPDPRLRGASVYTLSDRASDREAAMLAARENRAGALVDVQLDPEDDVMASILIDLAQRITRSESHAFAELMVDSLARETLLLNNTHREAGFAVLTAPDVPSVLVELGYLSNEEDEELLAQAEHQERLVRALARSVDSYFVWLAELQGP